MQTLAKRKLKILVLMETIWQGRVADFANPKVKDRLSLEVNAYNVH
jgi:hypothetical protein